MEDQIFKELGKTKSDVYYVDADGNVCCKSL